MAEFLNAHGSRNDIFVAGITPAEVAAHTDLPAFVRDLCARGGPFGGDGVYFYDAGPAVAQAWFFNPDSSPAEFCGNGMRCLGRVLLDRRGTDHVVVRSGSFDYTVRRAPSTDGVARVTVEHPPVDFGQPVVAGLSPLTGVPLPELDPDLEFTAVSIPNPHLVAVVDDYDEPDLIAMGERVASRPDRFPSGANLSVLLPLAPDEVFVRTFERGAGLTASCGSGMAAARAVYSRLALASPERPVLIRNAGGMADVALRVRADRWHPVLTGNATFVYRTDINPAAMPRTPHLEHFPEETRAYSTLEAQNAARLQATHIKADLTSHPHQS